MRDNAVMLSSTMPSAKCTWSTHCIGKGQSVVAVQNALELDPSNAWPSANVPMRSGERDDRPEGRSLAHRSPAGRNSSQLSLVSWLRLSAFLTPNLRRRRITPKPTRAVPNTAIDAGSGMRTIMPVTAISVK